MMSPSLGLVDRQADDGLGLALEHGLGQNSGLVARARRPGGGISALTFFEPHLVVSCLGIQNRSWRWIVDTKKPGAVSRPGAARQFQFHQ
jgi:hypothetical protein